jgi:hypothetical protein
MMCSSGPQTNEISAPSVLKKGSSRQARSMSH